MRTALLMVFTVAVAACGQTGSLYLPDDSVETPVEIRTEQEKKKAEKATPPPGR